MLKKYFQPISLVKEEIKNLTWNDNYIIIQNVLAMPQDYGRIFYIKPNYRNNRYHNGRR